MATAELSGTQKAAILLMCMGRERAGRVMKMMRESEVEEIATEIARQQIVKKNDADSVLVEFSTIAQARESYASGGVEVAKELLQASLGAERAQELIDRLAASIAEAPFEFLRKADPRQVLSFLRDEHPQTIALVMAHMHPNQASLVLGGLPEDVQREVSVRIAKLDRTSPEVVSHIESALARKFSTVVSNQSQDATSQDGLQLLVDILNRSDRATERSIFEGLETSSADLADAVRSRMFVFEDIVQLDDKAIQLILRQVDVKQLAVALKGVRVEVKTKIIKNMSERAGQNLEEEIVLLGPVRMKQVEEEQVAIVRVIRALEEQGQLVLARGGDEFVS
jgi:flagellar motor switch protein FliG